MRTTFGRCPGAKGSLLFLLAAGAVALIGLSPAPASAQTCVQDEFNSLNLTHKTLSCTANDVSVSSFDPKSINIFSGGSGDKCFQGTTFSFTADFEIKTTSSKTRSNIGIFFATGQNQALTGTCSQAILSPRHTSGCAVVSGTPTATCGSIEYEELDQAINGETGPSAPGQAAGCGDTTSADTSTFGPGTQRATLEIDSLACTPTPCPAGSGFTGDCVALPVCTSWWQPTTTMPQCISPGPSYPWQLQAVPGTSSKCNCSTLFIPVQPITPSVTVAKSCNTAISTQTSPPLTSCDEGAGDVSSNTVTYTVSITNTTPANEGGVIIDQICDSLYGQIFPSSGTCPAGTIGSSGSLISTTCSSTMPGDIANGGSGSCTFTAHQNENLTKMDTVSVTGHSDISTTATFGPTSSNTVTVTSEDSPSTASTTKGLANPPATAACITARYNVQVANTSSADETLTLSALNDSKYGNITACTNVGCTNSGPTTQVLGTTCGVDSSSSGLGSLSGSKGAGTLPATIAPGGSYACQFDGQFCGAVAAGAEEFGTGTCNTMTGFCSAGQSNSTMCTKNSDCDLTCTGISQTDTVTGTITGDESEVVTQTITGLNLTECVQSFTSPH